MAAGILIIDKETLVHLKEELLNLVTMHLQEKIRSVNVGLQQRGQAMSSLV